MVGAEEEDSIVGGNHVDLLLLWALRLLAVEDMAWLPKLLDPVHLDQETLAMAWEPFPGALLGLRREAHDHLVVVGPVDNPRGSRSRNQRIKVTHSGCCPWDGHRWNWSCAFEDAAGHRDKATGQGADWTLTLERPSPSC